MNKKEVKEVNEENEVNEYRKLQNISKGILLVFSLGILFFNNIIIELMTLVIIVTLSILIGGLSAMEDTKEKYKVNNK